MTRQVIWMLAGYFIAGLSWYVLTEVVLLGTDLDAARAKLLHPILVTAFIGGAIAIAAIAIWVPPATERKAQDDQAVEQNHD